MKTLVLDGWLGWRSRMGTLRRNLAERLGDVEVYGYDTSGLKRFEALGADLAERIRACGGPVNVVAYSMGGMVLRAAHLLDPELPIRRSAFLNSPLNGTMMAYALPVGGIRQMRPGDAWIRRLLETPWPFPTLVVWTPLDAIVVPGSNARMTGADKVVRCDVPAHIWALFSRRIHGEIAAFLDETGSDACARGAMRRGLGVKAGG